MKLLPESLRLVPKITTRSVVACCASAAQDSRLSATEDANGAKRRVVKADRQAGLLAQRQDGLGQRLRVDVDPHHPCIGGRGGHLPGRDTEKGEET